MGEVILDSPIKKGKKKKRPSASLWWCFTWNNFPENAIADVKAEKGLDKYAFQHEVGENGTHHLQGTLKFKKPSRPQGMWSTKIHWEKTKAPQKSINYCGKDDTQVAGPWFKNCMVLEDEEEVRTIKREQLYNWQESLVSSVESEPDDRTIEWWWEPNGNVGKSALCKYLHVHHDALICGGKAADVKFAVVAWKQKHKTWPKIIIWDLVRSQESFISWQGIEEVKNGLFLSTKYECAMACYNSPHVVCMANFAPDESKLSSDRWKIREISKESVCGFY